MQSLQYLLPRPPYRLTRNQRADCEALLDATPPGAWIDYHLSCPKWQFLMHLCQGRELVLHGSQNAQIAVVRPRKAQDVRAFSAQEAIYATTDGIWVIFFAIVDREGYSPLSLFNSCLSIFLPLQQKIGPLYFFSITHTALVQDPWCEGAVYILPRGGFQQEADQSMLGARLSFPHWISSQPAEPLAKLRVGPADFPFLAQVHGHDDEILNRLYKEDPNGFPWPAALISSKNRGSQ
jgi:hypothetical protein